MTQTTHPAPSLSHSTPKAQRGRQWLMCLLALLAMAWLGAVACEPGTGSREDNTPTEPRSEGQRETAPDGGQSEPTQETPPPDTTPSDQSQPPEPTPEPTAETTPEPTPEPASDAVVTPDASPDTAPEKVAETPPETTADSPIKSPITLSVASVNDVVTSYLLSGSSWNYFHGATVKLGRHSNVGNTSYFTAFRFTGVNIPKGATITSAYVSWMPHNEVDSSNRLMINIYAEREPDSSAYDPKNYTKGRPDQRLKTSAKIDRWVVRCRDDCSSDVSSPKYEYDCPQRKKDCWDRTTRYQCPKDLKTIVQEVVDQTSWKAGNAISLFLFNAATDNEGPKYKDSRTLIGYDAAKPQSAPQLVVHFTR